MHAADQVQERRQKLVRVVQFAVYCWAMRLGFVGIGSILVSFIQFFVPSSPLNLKPFHLNVRNWNLVVRDNYQNLLEPREPVLYREIGVISPSLLRTKFTRVTPIESMHLKLSTTPEYSYFDDSRLWSKSYVDKRGYSFIQSMKYFQSASPHKLKEFFETNPIQSNQSSVQTCPFDVHDGECFHFDEEHFVYGTHSHALSYLPALSPELAQYVALENEAPQVCMWISSANVTAGLHFDLEDNFLLQIYGQKKITIVSPEALPLLNPHSSWHPNWRQASNVTNVRTTKELLTYLDDKLLSSHTHYTNSTPIGEVELNAPRKPKIPKKSKKPKKPAVPVTPIVSAKGSTTASSFGEVKIWEATLLPGDAIFIPAGYFHMVTSTTASLSINTWFNSQLSNLYTQLENYPLPFTPEEDEYAKLLKVVKVVQVALKRLDVPVAVFTSLMKTRYKDQNRVIEEEGFVCNQNLLTSTSDSFNCSTPAQLDHENQIAITKIDTDTETLYDIITANERVTPALAVLVLLDYVEEVLQLIWGDEATSLEKALAFATQCFSIL